MYDPLREFKRLALFPHPYWRIVDNHTFTSFPTYPARFLVPASVTDAQLDAVASYRCRRRVPAVVWMHAGTGAVLARSAQPMAGWRAARCAVRAVPVRPCVRASLRLTRRGPRRRRMST